MAKHSASSPIFWIVLNLAVGAMLAVGGVWALQGGGDFAADALKGLASGSNVKILGIAFGIVELLSGIFIILQCFINDGFGKLGYVLKVIICVIWALAIVIADILNGDFGNFLSWVYTFASHLIVLAALLITRS
ncbi:MAG: hypothetical protein IKO57_07690 [Treponema sp.]|nr:hypothetical protein [Treponema sp.]MBR6914258.1 hypothetical protein [Treponema sp.]MCR5126081.1 hypothetical protein [Treponema sp.]